MKLLLALLLSAGPAFACAHGDTNDLVDHPCSDLGIYTIAQPQPLMTNCVTMIGVMELCSTPPTIWINPALEPRDVANRLLGAFQEMGYISIQK